MALDEPRARVSGFGAMGVFFAADLRGWPLICIGETLMQWGGEWVLCQNLKLGNVLGLVDTLHHVKISKESLEIKVKPKWKREHPPVDLIQKGQIKIFSKNSC